MTQDTAIKIRDTGKKIANASLGSIIIAVGLMIVAKKAQTNGDLLRAWILVVTSNFVMLVYLFGLRRYFKQIQNLVASEKDKDKNVQ